MIYNHHRLLFTQFYSAETVCYEMHVKHTFTSVYSHGHRHTNSTTNNMMMYSLYELKCRIFLYFLPFLLLLSHKHTKYPRSTSWLIFFLNGFCKLSPLHIFTRVPFYHTKIENVKICSSITGIPAAFCVCSKLYIVCSL